MSICVSCLSKLISTLSVACLNYLQIRCAKCGKISNDELDILKEQKTPWRCIECCADNNDYKSRYAKFKLYRKFSVKKKVRYVIDVTVNTLLLYETWKLKCTMLKIKTKHQCYIVDSNLVVTEKKNGSQIFGCTDNISKS